MEYYPMFVLLVLLYFHSEMSTSSSVQSDGIANQQLSPPVQELCDEYWNWRLRNKPQFATFVGISDFNEEMDDLSLDAYESTYNQTMDFLAMTTKLTSSLLNKNDILNIKILEKELSTYRDGYQYNGFYLPISYFEGPHADYMQLLDWMPKTNLKNYETMLRRMEKFATQIDQMITLLRKGVETGIKMHKISMKTVDESLSSYIVADPTDSPFYKFFNSSLPSEIDASSIKRLRDDAGRIIKDSIVPAYRKLRSYLNDEYQTRPNIAITSLPNGEQLYNQLIKFHTSSSNSPQEIHKLGINQVADIEGQMYDIIRKFGLGNISVNQFSAKIREDPTNYFNTSDEIMAKYNEVVHNTIFEQLKSAFNYIPQTELEVVDSPSSSGPTAFYYAGSLDGSRPGRFLVNTHNPRNQPRYSIMTLSLHEGNPGHHLQASYNMETPGIPFFRRASDDSNYNIPPSKFPMYTDYVEGWALYSESLGFDMGLYSNLLDRYGHYSEEIFRACRLVVDTGMHALGWSKQEAVDFMLNHTASSETSILNEIDRYITWPGQALGYKMGELAISDLRNKAEERLGLRFDLKAFHDVILSSYGPMSVVQDMVNEWINEKDLTP